DERAWCMRAFMTGSSRSPLAVRERLEQSELPAWCRGQETLAKQVHAHIATEDVDQCLHHTRRRGVIGHIFEVPAIGGHLPQAIMPAHPVGWQRTVDLERRQQRTICAEGEVALAA